SEQLARPPSEYRHPSPPRGNRSYGWQRVLISLAVLAVMAGVAFGLASYLRGSPKGNEKSAPNKIVEILPQVPIPKPGDLPPPRSIASSAPKSAPPAADLPPTKIQAGVAAMEVLDKFLSAKTLADRLPLIETSLNEKDLQASVLAAPFPADPRVSPDIQETNRAENFTDIYYNVDLQKPDGKFAPYLILLRARGENPPKVIVDPFLDSYGGRLSRFAAAPSDQTMTVQVVISAVAKTTSDQKLPNHEQKLWLKLLPRDNEKEIASAYFTKISKIGEMLTDDSSGFRYGQARPARLTLQWNTKEDPAMPFLEAIDIKEFRWNP
ncbi:MAG TPA: hypothetical protein VM511_07420, partial [Luteolibacter sp.]|nr:hypothetical protein [Luteolibacter sp.]